jgi:hypothetical protein
VVEELDPDEDEPEPVLVDDVDDELVEDEDESDEVDVERLSVL